MSSWPARLKRRVSLLLLGARGRLWEVTVAGSSMEPSFKAGDRVWCQLRPEDLRIAEVVVIEWPPASGGYLLKRVAALEGADSNEFGCGESRVPPGHVLVLSDNLAAAADSRTLGPLPVSTIVGRVLA
jgi:signal peptidase I